MRIATWNLDRPWKNGKTTRAARQLEIITQVGADIWVLTETYSGFTLPGFRSVASPSSLGPYHVSESAAAVWAPESWPIKLISATSCSVIAEVTRPDNASLLVYGSIIPYHAAPGGRNWEVHINESARQSAEWATLKKSYPTHSLIVAGDFNMTLHDDRGYGCAAGRQNVRRALRDLGMKCPSAVDIRALDFGHLERDNIDHICVDGRWTATTPDIWHYPHLSDHNGVAVDLE